MSTCSVPHCESGAKTRGYCAKHYENFRRTGDPISKHEKKRLAPKPPCGVDGCGRDARSKGLCNRHYENLRNYGDPVPQRDHPLDERLREVGWDITASGCWEWRGARNELGYGLISAERQGIVGARAHRLMYELTTGDLLEDRVLRHKCDNPSCVNPDHLEPGSQRDNMRDMADRGRQWTRTRTECPKGHDLTLPGATFNLNACRECDRDRKRRYAQRRRAAGFR